MRSLKTARRDKVEIYLHIMWTTWDRMEWIKPQWEDDLYGVIGGMAQRHQGILIACGGVADHVHLLTTLHSTTRLCDLVRDMKGNAARLGCRHVEGFKWRPTYAAFSVSRWDVAKLKSYILSQKEHHQQGTADQRREEFDEEYWYDDMPEVED